MDLFFMITAMKRAGADKVYCIIPYFAYQFYGSDFAFSICKMLESIGCDMVVTINFTGQYVKGYFPPKIPMLNVDVMDIFVPYLVNKNLT